MFESGDSTTTKIGYKNKNNQENLGTRWVKGTDHGQYSYKLACGECGHIYGANGTDVFQKQCPECQGGKPGIGYDLPTLTFENWLLQIGKSPRSAKSYSGAISGVMSDWAKEANLIKNPLLDVTSPKTLNEISEKLSQVGIFVARNTKGKGMYSSALKAYAEYLSDTSSEEIQEDIEELVQSTEIEDTEKSTFINARVGQGKFRKGLIEYWSGCAVTGFADTRFLVASHIKPWRKSDNQERLDSFNGLLLLPNIDKAFDMGYITFKEQGRIMLSPELEQADTLGINPTMTIRLQKDHQTYLAYHRDEVFKK
jgi:putative restriction endonuclease